MQQVILVETHFFETVDINSSAKAIELILYKLTLLNLAIICIIGSNIFLLFIIIQRIERDFDSNPCDFLIRINLTTSDTYYVIIVLNADFSFARHHHVLIISFNDQQPIANQLLNIQQTVLVQFLFPVFQNIIIFLLFIIQFIDEAFEDSLEIKKVIECLKLLLVM